MRRALVRKLSSAMVIDPDDFERVGEWFAALDASETARLAKLQAGLREPVNANEASRVALKRKRKSR